jgi:hypothetical protein
MAKPKLYVVERRRVMSDQTYVVQWLATNNPRTQWTFEKDNPHTGQACLGRGFPCSSSQVGGGGGFTSYLRCPVPEGLAVPGRQDKSPSESLGTLDAPSYRRELPSPQYLRQDRSSAGQ